MSAAGLQKSVLALSLLAAAAGARAAENGLSHFAVGAQTAYAAFLPPPGETTFFGYALYLGADSLRDDSGNRIPGVDASAIGLAARVVHTWKQRFGGFKLSSGVLALAQLRSILVMSGRRACRSASAPSMPVPGCARRNCSRSTM